MKQSFINHLIGGLLLTLTVIFLFSCATHKETTQPSGTPDQAKPASEPPAKAQEATTPPPSPKPTTTTSPLSSPPPKSSEASQPPAQRSTEIVLAFVNLREGPSMDSKIISVLKKGPN